MNKLKLDIKTVITLIVLIFTIAGFYYRAESRIDTLEINTLELEKKIKVLQRKIRRMEKKK